jgi:hypothetical protein
MECKQSKNLPPLVMDSQEVVCPNCKFYWRGQCSNPARTSAEGPCPFDGKELPLREATLEDGKSPDDLSVEGNKTEEVAEEKLKEMAAGLEKYLGPIEVP